jgi:fatty-acyl-CoA synthase
VLKLTTRASYQTLLDAAALRSGENPALIYLQTDTSPQTITRSQFAEHVRQHGAALQKRGIGPRDLVVIAHTQNVESIYLFWGALYLGAIPSMFPTLTEKLDPAIYAANMAELVRFSDVKAVFTTDDFAPQLAETVGCPVYGTVEADSGSGTPFSSDPDEIAFLQHSSGTTGLQKGVALSHNAVLNQLAAYSDAIALNERDVIVSWLPLYHDMGLIAGFLLPLVQGVPLVLMSPFDWVKHPAMLLRAIHDYKGTLCWLPNFAYNHMARRVRDRDIEGVRLDSMRAFVNCSEPVYAQSHGQFAERFADYGVTRQMLTVSYAMAENTFAVTQTPLGAEPRIDHVDQTALEIEKRAVPGEIEKVSCGPPIAGTEVRVTNEDGAVLSERYVGELSVRSDYMLTEYYMRDDLDPFTADGWYLTGDMGYIADGEVYVIGRKKDLIINAGKNVYPQDIEAIVNTVPGVKPGRAVVFGVPDDREGTELIAVVAEVTEDDPDALKGINKGIRQAVAIQTTVTVNYVKLVDTKWLIKTSSGKIARAANRDKWLQERS